MDAGGIRGVREVGVVEDVSDGKDVGVNALVAVKLVGEVRIVGGKATALF